VSEINLSDMLLSSKHAILQLSEHLVFARKTQGFAQPQRWTGVRQPLGLLSNIIWECALHVKP
jgi:hypothetical protein